MPDLPSSAPTTGGRTLVVGMVTLVTVGAFESLAVSTAMPVVARALDGLGLYSAAFAVTMATSVVGMVASGVVADRARPVVPLLAGVVSFVVGLVVAALTPSMALLLVGRALQGLGSGAYVVALYMIVARAFAPSRRAQVLAWFSAAWVVPSVVGPVVAGVIVDTVGWRWVFGAVALVAAPAAAVVAATTWRVAGPAEVPSHEVASPDVSSPDAPSPAAPDAARVGLRRVGLGALAGAGVTAVSVGAQVGGPAGLGAGAVGLAAALLAGRRLLPPGTLRGAPGLPAVIGLRGAVAAGFFATEVLLPLILQTERGLSPARAGTILTVAAVTWALGSSIRGRGRLAPRTYLRIGTGLGVAGILVASTLVVPAVPLAAGWAGWALAGLGVGMVYPTLALLVFELAPPAEHGTATSALQVCDALATALAIALTGAAVHVVVDALGTSGYLLGFALTTLIALGAVWLAGRAQPASVPASADVDGAAPAA